MDLIVVKPAGHRGTATLKWPEESRGGQVAPCHQAGLASATRKASSKTDRPTRSYLKQ